MPPPAACNRQNLSEDSLCHESKESVLFISFPNIYRRPGVGADAIGAAGSPIPRSAWSPHGGLDVL